MNLKEVKLVTTAYLPDQLILTGPMQVAFAGRSNVGKSSLLNRLFNRRGLAKVSNTPGKTQSINYFYIDNQIYFVDLPGYGYAKTSAQERIRWQKLLEHYFENSKVLAGLAHLIDIRHEPTEHDLMLHEWTQPLVKRHLYVLTKSDKVSRTRQVQAAVALAKHFQIDRENIVTFSAETGDNKHLILQWVTSLIE
ncbi:MAG: ribosome biogenesis GTP-binding protein YihA/YsxC [candidate division Zixibacteria bacterium]|nr:ribosome biogenesis GTP-binding protein YihA/YsxC [candidate division Zixibacteria bacterium]